MVKRSAVKRKLTHIKDLVPDPKNRRKHTPRNVGMIVDALHEVGAGRSIVIDENDVVLAGNATIEAAGEAGIVDLKVVDAKGSELVAVRRTGLSEAQKRDLALYDNRAGELAEWDVEQLLKDLDASIDLSAFFSDKELGVLLAGARGDEGLTDPDEVPAQRTTDIKTGDLFTLGDHRLLCGGCKHGENIARLLDGENAKLMTADPEYDDLDMSWLGFPEIATIDHWLVMASDRQHAAALKQNGELFNQFLVVYFKQFSWNLNVYIPLLQHVCIAHYKTNGAVNHHLNGLHSVIECSSKFDRSASHPHAKHVELLSLLLQGFSASDDCVLDLFSGSGTTIIAAEQLGRKCYAIEIEPSYCQVTIDRWEAFTGKTANKEAQI